MTRRALVGAGFHGVLGLAGVASCQQAPPRREDVLSSLVEHVVVPDTAALVATSTRLDAVMAGLAHSGSLDAFLATRAAWRTALLAWKRAQCFALGPIVETSSLVRATFWPARSAAIDAALSGTGALDDVFVAELGVDARGLYALEYLLFPLSLDPQAASALFSLDGGKRRRELAAGLARAVTGQATAVAGALGDGKAYAARFAQGGQLSLSALVSEVSGTVENLSARRLAPVLNPARARLLEPREVEGGPAGISHELALAQLEGAERVYSAGSTGGLDTLALAVAPAIAGRLKQKFELARGAVRALNAPLERLVTTNPAALRAAATATKELEIAIKVDLASALGVTIAFRAGDGD